MMVSSANENPMLEARKTLNGGGKITQTHITVAAYPLGDEIYFAQLVAREIVGNFGTDLEKSNEYGLKF